MVTEVAGVLSLRLPNFIDGERVRIAQQRVGDSGGLIPSQETLPGNAPVR